MNRVFFFISIFFCCIVNISYAQLSADLVDYSKLLLSADSTTQFKIGSIKLSGNKRTKSYIVFREIPFKEGNYFFPKALTKQLELAKDQIMNTTLFIDVTVYVSNLVSGVVTINVDVKERWYLFPLPYFKLVDRNFNQWWSDQSGNLERVNYGLKFFHNNVSGRNDKLNIDLVNGYNQQVVFGYNQPFADKSLKHGFSVNFIYSRQREMNYNTLDNKQAFIKLPEFIREFQRSSFTYSYRPDSKYRFSARIGYTRDNVNDTILKLNPEYFPTANSSLNFFDAAASLQYYAVDYIPFPKKGFMYEVNLYNRGFSSKMNMLSLSVEATNAIKLSKNWFIQLHNVGVVRMNDDQPYYNRGLMGYGDFYLRGMESYVVDGTAGFISNTTLYRKLFTYVFRPPFIKTKTHDKIPFTFYLKAFGDMGYTYNKQQNIKSYTNSFLPTTGIGLDIVSIYDFVFRIEYSFNQYGDKGFAFRTRGDF